MGQSGADGPKSGGGHRFLNEAYRAGVPRDWVLKLGSPEFRELQAEREERRRTEMIAVQVLAMIANRFPALAPVIVDYNRTHRTALAIINDETFKVLAQEQLRRLQAYERETGSDASER